MVKSDVGHFVSASFCIERDGEASMEVTEGGDTEGCVNKGGEAHLHLVVHVPRTPAAIAQAVRAASDLLFQLESLMSEAHDNLPWGLYWVEDADHEVDWFVVARSQSEAELYFEEVDDVTASRSWLVKEIPETDLKEIERRVHNPDEECLKRLGLEVVAGPDGQNGWRYGGGVYYFNGVAEDININVHPRIYDGESN